MGKLPTGHAVTSRCDNYLYLLQWFFSETDKTFSNLICQSENTDPRRLYSQYSTGSKMFQGAKYLKFVGYSIPQRKMQSRCDFFKKINMAHPNTHEFFFDFESLKLLSLGFKNTFFAITCLIRNSCHSHFHLAILTDVTL